jgi:hypothetical protein
MPIDPNENKLRFFNELGEMIDSRERENAQKNVHRAQFFVQFKKKTRD